MSFLQMSFLGAVLILIIVLARALLIYKLPKRTFYFLWIIALLRLLVPFSFTSIISIYTLVQKSETVMDAVEQLPAQEFLPVQAGEPGMDMQQDFQGITTSAGSRMPEEKIVWVLGAFLCFAFFACTYVNCYRKFRMSLPVQTEQILEWHRLHSLKRTIEVRQSDMIAAPLSYGIVHPVILMPKSTDWSDSSRLRYVLEHEYVHIRRFDAVSKLLMAAALCIHWFNPFVWVMYILFNRDMELSCDEIVLHRFGENTKSAYAMTLIDMEEKKSGLMPLCSNFSKHAIEERIRAIMKIRKVTFISAAFAGILTAGITLCFAATAADNGQDMAQNLAGSSVMESNAEENLVQPSAAGSDNMPDSTLPQGAAGTLEEGSAGGQDAEAISRQAQEAAAAVGYDEKAIAARIEELNTQIREKEKIYLAGTKDADVLLAEIEAVREEQMYLELMQQDIEQQKFFDTSYGSYGICYKLPECRLYKGETSVGYFCDEAGGGCLWADNNGELYVEVIRNENGDIVRLIAEDAATYHDTGTAYQVAHSERFSEYEKCGISYDSASGYLMYEGRKVGYFKDEYEPGAYTRFTDQGGELGIVVVRNTAGDILEIQSDLPGNMEGMDSNASTVERAAYVPSGYVSNHHTVSESSHHSEYNDHDAYRHHGGYGHHGR